MCGIVGTIQWGDGNTLEKMTDLLAHRGPDDRGVVEIVGREGSRVGLGARRLAIQDLSPAGHMPMSSEDGELTVVFNGEIYNYPALRRELEARGVRFRSHCDTEVLLHLYRAEGPDFVRRLNGMFAMALWDATTARLFLARDHFGIKPLYFVQRGSRLAFASEIKALLELPDAPAEMDPEALDRYLTFLWVPEPDTILRGVRKLPAGSYATFRSGELRITSYWEPGFPPAGHAFPDDPEEVTAELRWRFEAAVGRQLIGDVPLGAFLSAGVDSSGIVAAMQRQQGAPPRTFTITFPPGHRRGEVHLDDPAVARRTAQRLGCDHTEIVVEPDIVGLLPKLVWHMDEPLADPALIMAYLVAREARPHVTVLLSGIGGDEVFGGYRKYRGHELAERIRRLPLPVRRWIRPAVEAMPAMRGTPWKGYVRLARKLVAGLEMEPRERFVMAGTYLDAAERHALYGPALRGERNGADPWAGHLEAFERVRHADFLNQMLYVDMKTFMPSLNLNYNDKMSMASSVEVRVPFLDPELAEWVAWNVAPDLKLHDGRTKHVLREAVRPWVPDEVLRQRKAGFGAPIDHWVRNELAEMLGDLLGEERIRERGLFDPGAVRRLLLEHREGRRDRSFQIWQLLTLELWMQAFLDRR